MREYTEETLIRQGQGRDDERVSVQQRMERKAGTRTRHKLCDRVCVELIFVRIGMDSLLFIPLSCFLCTVVSLVLRAA